MTHKPWLSLLGLLLVLTSITGCSLLQQTGLIPPERSAISPYGYFERTGDMHIPRAGHTATLLSDGKVLIAGGYTLKKIGKATLTEEVKQGELYDPKTGKFALTGSFNETHKIYQSFILPNGKVFFYGLPSLRAELYNPTTKKFELAGQVHYTDRIYGYLKKQPDNSIVLFGGTKRNDYTYHPKDMPPERFNIQTMSFQLVSKNQLSKLDVSICNPKYIKRPKNDSLSDYSSINISKNKQLIVGGISGNVLRKVEIYDISTQYYKKLGDMFESRAHPSLNFIDTTNSKLLICGGWQTHKQITKSCELLVLTRKEI